MRIYQGPYKDTDLPEIDLLTFLFESDWTAAKEDTPIHVEAANEANSITKAEAGDLVRRVGHTLRHKYGIGSTSLGQDVVLATSSGNPFLPNLFYSTICAGGVFSGASTAYTVTELVRQITVCGAKLLLCSPEFEEKTVKAAEECNIPLNRVLIIDSKTPKRWNLIDASARSPVLNLIDGPMHEWQRFNGERECHDATDCISYSSGTTGLPKGVRISQWNLLACCPIDMHVGEAYRARMKRGGRPFTFRTIAHLPIAHVSGITWYSLHAFYLGGTTYWMEKYDFDSFIEYARKYRITYLLSVPPLWLQIAKSPKVTDHFDSLVAAASAAAPLGVALGKEVSAKLGKGKATLGQYYGLTETTAGVTGTDWELVDESFSVGAVLPNVRVRLVDDNDKDVEPGEPGEMLVTGDIAVCKDGLMYIVDRKKELFKYKGLQVAPAEIEARLISHPMIQSAAVIGIQDDSRATELPRAYVVARPGEDVTQKEVADFVKDNLASHKQLRGGVVFVDEIPVSASARY